LGRSIRSILDSGTRRAAGRDTLKTLSRNDLVNSDSVTRLAAAVQDIPGTRG